MIRLLPLFVVCPFAVVCLTISILSAAATANSQSNSEYVQSDNARAGVNETGPADQAVDETRLQSDDDLARSLVQQLSSANFLQRQIAAERLWRMGDAAKGMLERAARQTDREVAKRAGEILKIYEMGIDSNTSPEIAKLVLFFHESGTIVRSQVLTLLSGQNRFELLYQLLEQVKEPSEREGLYRLVFGLNDCLMRLARKHEWDDIRYLLNHPLTFQYDPMVVVYFGIANGNLDEIANRLQAELETRTADGKTIEDADWMKLIAIERIQNDYEAALKTAAKIEDITQRFGLTLQILMEQGDWDEIAGRMIVPNENITPEDGKFSLNLAQQALIYHFADKEDKCRQAIQKMSDKISELEQNGLKDDVKAARRLVLQVALSTLDFETASQQFDDVDLSDLFELKVALKRYDEAAETIKLGSTCESRVTWMNRRIRNIKSLNKKIERQENNNEDYDAAERDRRQTWRLCLDVAEHLGNLGLTDEALLHYRTLFASLDDEAYDFKRDVIRSVMNLGAYEEVWKMIEWGFSNSDQQSQLIYYLFPNKIEAVNYWRSQLFNQYPDPVERLKVIATILNSPLGTGDVAQVEAELAKIRGAASVMSGSLEFQIANVNEYFGRLDESRLHLEAAASLKNDEARFKLGLQQLKEDEPLEAAKLFDEIYQNRGGAVNAMLAAVAFEEAGMKTEAANRKLISFVHWFESYRSDSIVRDFENVDKQEHISDFLKVYVCAPGTESISDERYRRSLGLSYAENDKEQAATCLQIMALEVFANEGNTERSLAFFVADTRTLSVLLASNKIACSEYESANRLLEAYNRFNPGDAEVGEKIVPAFDAAGRSDDANQLFEQVTGFYLDLLSEYPRSPLHHNNYAWICACGKRRMGNAMRHCQIAVELRPTNSSYLDTMAEVEFLQGNKARAIELARKCIQINPRKPHYQKQVKRFSE